MVVLGSGPAGISCTLGLLDAGRSVVMIDTGLKLEEERSQSLRELQGLSPENWNLNGATDFLRNGITADVSGIPLKRAYGSDYPYRAVPGATAIQCRKVHTQASLAAGGFSNVWGAAMLPYRQADIQDWPVSEQELAPHFTSILKSIPIAGREDDLSRYFPLYSHPEPYPISRQAESLLSSMHRNAPELAKRGLVAGAARLAVRHGSTPGCVKCGLCMYGCPHELIYSSAFTLQQLSEHPNFTYISGYYAKRVTEKNGSVAIECLENATGEQKTFQADRVCVACGVVGTTAILLRSLERYDQPIRMQDSQYFLQPCFMVSGSPEVRKEGLHTLAQAFIELMDHRVSQYTVHCQVYTYNELFDLAMKSSSGPLYPLLPHNTMLSRLVVLQGYVHSYESAKVSCLLTRTEDGDALQLTGEENTKTASVIHRVQRKLLSASRFTGLVPIPMLLRKGLPGRGFHTGGSFPMNANPGPSQTDVLGRPVGLSRIHAVDSTVFPSVPATTITLTSMANAHRIGTAAGQL